MIAGATSGDDAAEPVMNDRFSASLLFALVLAGCGGEVSLGNDTDAATPSGSGPGVSLPDGAPPVQDGVTGTWTGYVESYQFPSGSDALTLVLASDGKGTVSGTLAFGAGQAPPPPTVDVAEPPIRGLSASLPIPEAVPLAIHDVVASGARLRFGVRTLEAWKAFCELQTPLPAGNGAYSCLPYGGGGGDGSCYYDANGSRIPVDCGKFELCQYCGVSCSCSCTASGCTVDSQPDDVDFDVAISSGTASGSTSGRLGDKNVHLTRAQ